MSRADKLREIADYLDDQLDLEQQLAEARTECNYLEGENWYLKERLRGLGVDPEKSLSVADVMAIEKALEMAKV